MPNFEFEIQKLLKEKDDLLEIQKLFTKKSAMCKKRLFEFLNLIQFLIFFVVKNKNSTGNVSGISLITKHKSFKATQLEKGQNAKSMFI